MKKQIQKEEIIYVGGRAWAESQMGKRTHISDGAYLTDDGLIIVSGGKFLVRVEHLFTQGGCQIDFTGKGIIRHETSN